MLSIAASCLFLKARPKQKNVEGEHPLLLRGSQLNIRQGETLDENRRAAPSCSVSNSRYVFRSYGVGAYAKKDDDNLRQATEFFAEPVLASEKSVSTSRARRAVSQ